MAEETEDLKQTFDSVLQVVRRRRWWILSAFCAASLIAIGVSFLMPDRYKSTATILVEPQRVSDRYVTPTSTSDLLQELQGMTQRVLSRNQLLAIIEQFDLYPREKKRLGPDELVDLMRKSIDIEPLVPAAERRDKDPDAFKISFVGAKPDTTADVVNQLTSLFIAGNLKTREEAANDTTRFLQSQLSAAQADLRQQEQRMKDFKLSHLGELPQEQQGNLAVLSSLQMQLQNVQSALGRAREQQVYMESLLAQYRSLAPKMGSDPSQTGPLRVAVVEKQLADLRTQRAALIAHYTPEHPDVVNINRQIAQTETLLDTLKKNQKTGGDSTDSALAITPEDDAGSAQLKSQLKANQLEITNDLAEQGRLQGRIADYQRRLNLTPVREAELSDLLRDYSLSQTHYADLERKVKDSELSTRLEQNQQGRQFRIVDPANLPTRPFSPDRSKFGLMGAGLGLAIGAALALILELKDSSFHSEREVARLFDLPFVFGVPAILSPTENRRRTSRRVLELAGGCFLVSFVLAAELFVMLRG